MLSSTLFQRINRHPSYTPVIRPRAETPVEPPATAVSGTAFEPQPVVQLQDASGEDIARGDVVVTVQISAGGGTLDGTTSATSDHGTRVRHSP